MDNTTPKYPELTPGTRSGRVGGLPDLQRNSAMKHDPMTPQKPSLTPELMMQEQHKMLQEQHKMQMQQMQAAQQPQRLHNRSKVAAALLAFLLGGLGAHKFYLGQLGQGILYLLFSWTFIPVFVAFVEVIVFLTQSDDAFDKAHNYK